MKILSVDFTKCKDCGMCESLLPRFRTVYGGILKISSIRVEEEEIRAAAQRVIRGCPEEAVSLQEYED